MLDIQRIRDNPEAIKNASAAKKDRADVDAILAVDEARRSIIVEVEKLKNIRNTKSAEIALLKKEKKDAAGLIGEMKGVSDSIKELDSALGAKDVQLEDLMAQVPNLPHSSVPKGTSSADNVVVEQWGTLPEFDFKPLDHLQLGEKLDILDFSRGAKISGAGFPVLKGHGALLDRALINFFLDTHTTKNGYREIFPPFLVNEASLYGTGQIPKSREQMYAVPEDGLFCIPTAEVPVTNLHRDEFLDNDALPLKYCAYSACFRREAGSYGKDTKGFLRVHQFNKVELVKFSKPKDSYAELETLRADAQGILKALGLPYRVLLLCDGDLSFSAAKCYDLEAWAPAEGKYLEVSSCSNFEDFQSRRMNIRFKPEFGGKPEFVHTLNGSGLATARILVAILETYQTKEGTVKIPEALWPYTNGIKEITPR